VLEDLVQLEDKPIIKPIIKPTIKQINKNKNKKQKYIYLL
jgi:hypothetical protein